MIKKMEKKQTKKSNKNTLVKNLKKKIIIRSLLFCSLLLVINTYAWFVFITKVDTNIDVHVASWDIQFTDNNELIREFNVNVTKINPDMEEFVKEISVFNSSEVQANFRCEVEEITLLGHTYTYNNTNEAISKLLNDYPFTISISPTQTLLDVEDEIVFSVRINWPYENINDYYKVNNLFIFDESIDYYSNILDTYQKINVTDENFNTYLNSDNLYVESDDADSFYGSKCGEYQENMNNACLSIKLKLIVDQADS